MIISEFKKIIGSDINKVNLVLQELKLQQKLLTTNAEKIRKRIEDETIVLIGSLKGKEKLLLRQVEFVTAHQKSLLDTQIANSLIIKGSLAGKQEMLEKCSEEDSQTLYKIKEIHATNLKAVSPLSMVDVKLECEAIAQAIEKFGEAQFPPNVMHQQSSVGPAKIEDYGDSEQEVLHKSINSSTTEIEVKFPKLGNNPWLASARKENLDCWLQKDRKNNIAREGIHSFFSDQYTKVYCFDSDIANALSSINKSQDEIYKSFDCDSNKSTNGSSIGLAQDVNRLECDTNKSTAVSCIGKPQDVTPTSECGLNTFTTASSSCLAQYETTSSECESNRSTIGSSIEVISHTDYYNNNLAPEISDEICSVSSSDSSIWGSPPPSRKGDKVSRGSKWLDSAPEQGLKRKIISAQPYIEHMENILASDPKMWLTKYSTGNENSPSFKKRESNSRWLSMDCLNNGNEVQDSCADKILYYPPSDSCWISKNKKCKYEEEQKGNKEQENCSTKENQEKTQNCRGEFFKKNRENKQKWLISHLQNKEMEIKMKFLNMSPQKSSKSEMMREVSSPSSPTIRNKLFEKSSSLDSWLAVKC